MVYNWDTSEHKKIQTQSLVLNWDEGRGYLHAHISVVERSPAVLSLKFPPLGWVPGAGVGSSSSSHSLPKYFMVQSSPQATLSLSFRTKKSICLFVQSHSVAPRQMTTWNCRASVFYGSLKLYQGSIKLPFTSKSKWLWNGAQSETLNWILSNQHQITQAKW